MAGFMQLHVVAVPAPAQGHVNPLMRFCKLLASQGVLVSFVNIEPVHHRIEELNMQQGAEEEEEEEEAAAAAAAREQGGHGDFIQKKSIQRFHVPIQGFDLANDFRISFEAFCEAMPTIASPLEGLILDLNQRGPPVNCLISDFSMTFPTQDVADKLNIPRVVFVPFSASALLFLKYVAQGDHISMPEVLARLSRRESKREVIFEGLPGLPTIYNNEAFSFKHIIDDTVFMYEFLIRSCKTSFTRAHAIVVNSFEEIEGTVLMTLSNQLHLPVYGVGPLVEPLHRDNSTSLWKENKACLHWLDQQPPVSVLYISFGSITLLTKTQLEEILDGLISSKQRFLWVFRPDLVKDISYSTFVPEILSRSHGKGFVVNWAPQLQVLSHPSVGGFLTHCGWNSFIEAISSGVPMVCWPYFADQLLNAKYIVEEWKVGLRFEASKNGSSVIGSCEIERVLKALMDGEEGKALRKNAMFLNEASRVSLLSRGSSYQIIQALLKSLV